MSRLTTLTESKWMSLFKCEQVTFAAFKRDFKVASGPKRVPLKTYAQKNNVSDAQLKMVYDWVVTNMPTYLKGVYKYSLHIPDDPLASIQQETMHNSKKSTSKCIVRNLYMRDLWQRTKMSLGLTNSFFVVLLQLCNEKVVDYKLLTRSGLGLIQSNKFAPAMSSFYFRSSVLNPALVYTLSKSLLKGSNVFTPTLGWSSYLLGFLANDSFNEYVGTDVIPRVCKTTEKVAAKYYPTKKVSIHCTPSEDLLNDKKFMKQHKGKFDVVFFSPPYFKLELYEGSNQSTRRYPDYEQWLEKYWDATMQLCAHVMKANARMGYIVSGYGDKPHLLEDMSRVASRYFRKVSIHDISNHNVGTTKHRPTGETLLIFKRI